MTTPRPYRLRTSRSPWSRWAGFVFVAFVVAVSAAMLWVKAPQIVAAVLEALP